MLIRLQLFRVALVLCRLPLLIQSHLDAFSSVTLLMALFLCSSVTPRSLKALHRVSCLCSHPQWAHNVHAILSSGTCLSGLHTWLSFSSKPPLSSTPKAQSVPTGPLALLLRTSRPCLAPSAANPEQWQEAHFILGVASLRAIVWCLQPPQHLRDATSSAPSPVLLDNNPG